MIKEIVIKLIDQLPAILTAAGVIVAAYLSYKANQNSKRNSVAIAEVEKSVNGKMHELLEVTKASSKAEGKLEEKDEQAVRDSVPKTIAVEDVVKVQLIEEPEKEQ